MCPWLKLQEKNQPPVLFSITSAGPSTAEFLLHADGTAGTVLSGFSQVVADCLMQVVAPQVISLRSDGLSSSC